MLRLEGGELLRELLIKATLKKNQTSLFKLLQLTSFIGAGLQINIF